MRRRLGASSLLLALILAAGTGLPARAQTPPKPAGPKAPAASPESVPSPQGQGRNVTATGRVMPPTSGRTPPAEAPKSSLQADMLKAQKAAEERNKAWDTKMRKTMGSICSGC